MKKIPDDRGGYLRPANDVTSYHYHNKFSIQPHLNSSQEISYPSEIDESESMKKSFFSSNITPMMDENIKNIEKSGANLEQPVKGQNSSYRGNLFTESQKQIRNEKLKEGAPKILLNSMTVKETEGDGLKKKEQEFKEIYERFEKVSEKEFLSPGRLENCELRSLECSERAIIGPVRTNFVNRSFKEADLYNINPSVKRRSSSFLQVRKE